MSHSTKSYTKNLSSRYLRLPVIDNFFKIAESSIFKKNQSNKCNSHPQLEKNKGYRLLANKPKENEESIQYKPTLNALRSCTVLVLVKKVNMELLNEIL